MNSGYSAVQGRESEASVMMHSILRNAKAVSLAKLAALCILPSSAHADVWWGGYYDTAECITAAYDDCKIPAKLKKFYTADCSTAADFPQWDSPAKRYMVLKDNGNMPEIIDKGDEVDVAFASIDSRGSPFRTTFHYFRSKDACLKVKQAIDAEIAAAKQKEDQLLEKYR
jgi:hypothetical protein